MVDLHAVPDGLPTMTHPATAGQVLQLILSGQASSRSEIGGRPAGRLAFHAASGVVLAASIGRSRIQLAIADLGCSLLAEESLEVDQSSGPQQCLPAVVDRLYEM